MLGFEALCLGDPRNVGVRCLRAVAGFTKDLEVLGFVCPAKGEGEDVVNVPRLPGLDGYVTRLAGSFSFQEEG